MLFVARMWWEKKRHFRINDDEKSLPKGQRKLLSQCSTDVFVVGSQLVNWIWTKFNRKQSNTFKTSIITFFSNSFRQFYCARLQITWTLNMFTEPFNSFAIFHLFSTCFENFDRLKMKRKRMKREKKTTTFLRWKSIKVSVIRDVNRWKWKWVMKN